MKKVLAVLLVFTLIGLYGCSRKGLDISEFSSAVGQYNPATKPDTVNKNYNLCTTKLVDLLLQPKSTKVSEADLLPDDSNFYIKIGEYITVGDISARTVEFGVKEKADGAGSAVFVQYYDRNSKRMQVKKLSEILTTASSEGEYQALKLYQAKETIKLDIEAHYINYENNQTYDETICFSLDGLEWSQTS